MFLHTSYNLQECFGATFIHTILFCKKKNINQIWVQSTSKEKKKGQLEQNTIPDN